MRSTTPRQPDERGSTLTHPTNLGMRDKVKNDWNTTGTKLTSDKTKRNNRVPLRERRESLAIE
jgi:hypothetical protein